MDEGSYRVVSLATLGICLIIGVLLQQVKTLPKNAHTTLGTLILHVPLPAICLLSIPDLEWNFSLIPLMLVAWIVFGTAFLGFSWLGKKGGLPQDLIGCLILTAGFSNTSFVGFPIIEATLGKEALKHAIFLDQSGSFLIVSSLGIWVAIKFSSGEIKKRMLLKKIFSFPPFITFVVSLFMGFLGIRFEGVAREVLERLSALLTPMALITVGLQLHWSAIKEESRFLLWGLSYKLILAPLIIFSLFFVGGVDLKIFQVSVLEAGMGPMITSSILAASHNLRPRLAGMMIGVGVPLSFFTLIFLYYLIKAI